MQNDNEIRGFYSNLLFRPTNKKFPSEPQPFVRAAVIYPCCPQPLQPPALYTYYVITSLIVVILAVRLIWIPFIHLIAEFNNIISKLLIYANKELLGNTNFYFLHELGEFINSQQGLVIISIICLVDLLYLVSADFLIFAACYINNLPNLRYFINLKMLALHAIDYLLSLTKKKECIHTNSPEKISQQSFEHH